MSETGVVLALGVMLFAKHFLADGPLQSGWQVANKGTFLHPGGLVHAAIHAALTWCCLLLWSTVAPGGGFDPLGADVAPALGLIGVEFVLHYFIDYFKMRLDQAFGWVTIDKASNGASVIVISDTRFFSIFLLDQLAHSVTYLGMLFVVASWI